MPPSDAVISASARPPASSSAAPPRSLAVEAAGGAAWTIATGIGARALGLVGTLAITYFVARPELGEVADAAVAVGLANQFSTAGVGQYYIARRDAGRDVAWHATVAHVGLGLVALAAVLALRHRLGLWMNAPRLGAYLPGLALAAWFDRVSYMPERVMARELRFRRIGSCRTAGELSYTAASVGLAAMGFGGVSIVVAGVLRSTVRLATMSASVPRAAWLSPARLSMTTVREMLRFGLPMSIGNAASFASRRVDNAIVSSFFGVDVVGAYNLAYNVADVPAVQVGEQVGDVLFPSFANMDAERCRGALLRSTGLLALVTFPLAVGLGAVAETTVRTLLKPEWRDVGPMLAILSALSVVRPVGWTISSYLLARNRPRVDASLEAFKLATLALLLFTVGRTGPLWACAAVGAAFGAHAVASMLVVQWLDGVSFAAFGARCAPPLLACAPMVGAVILVRHLASAVGRHLRGLDLALEIVTGALAYALAAPVIARTTSRDLLGLLRDTRRRRSPAPVVH
jgi:PST family polysaccharide transporter